VANKTAAQLGAFLLLRPWLVWLLQYQFVWAPVAVLNLTAMTVYCWHQTALLLVSFTGLLAGRPAGLLDIPTSEWVWYRLPILAFTLAGLTRLFHRHEPARRKSATATTS
jgi:hypothetical protein